ncbi:MAG: glycosyltransferase [Planctomycetes bacterium]|nr:glycosyltransferase [Planctomycetota bacterium]
MSRAAVLGICYPFPRHYASSILLEGLARGLEAEGDLRVAAHLPGEPGGRLWLLGRVFDGRRAPSADCYLTVIDVPLSVRLLRRLRGRPVAGVWYDAVRDIARERLPWRHPLEVVVRDNVAAADLVLPVSAELSRMAAEIRGGPRGVVDLALVGADLERFHPGVDGAEVRARHGIQPGEVVVALVGRIGGGGTTGDAANFSGRPLVRAAPAIVRGAGPIPVRFLVVGFGPGLAALRAAVREAGLEACFVCTGGLPHEEVPAHVAASDICLDLLDDVFAARARNETKIKEYMAAGKAIVATGIGEILFDLDGGRAGLCTRADNGDLVERVVELVRDPARRAALGLAARARAQERFAWPVLARRFRREVLPRLVGR